MLICRRKPCATLPRAQEFGLFLELGMRDLTPANLEKHLNLAEIMDAHFLRVVLGGNLVMPEEPPDALTHQAIAVLRAAMSDIHRLNLTLGLENHFDVPTAHLVQIVREIHDPQVGLIFDTTNGLGFINRPEETLRQIGPYLLSVHLKDYIVQKVEAGYLIRGTVLGEGWLDLDAILQSVLAYNPDASLILEMTIRRVRHLHLRLAGCAGFSH